jgi:hypothetical protein
LPKDQLPPAWLFNMNAYASNAIGSYILSLLLSGYQTCTLHHDNGFCMLNRDKNEYHMFSHCLF